MAISGGSVTLHAISNNRLKGPFIKGARGIVRLKPVNRGKIRQSGGSVEIAVGGAVVTANGSDFSGFNRDIGVMVSGCMGRLRRITKTSISVCGKGFFNCLFLKI